MYTCTCTTCYDLLNIEAGNTGGRWLRIIIISIFTTHQEVTENEEIQEDADHALTRFHLEAQATVPLLLVHPLCHILMTCHRLHYHS